MSVAKWFSFRRPVVVEIPDGWEVKRLREMASFAGGGRLGLVMSDYVSEGVDAYTAEGCNGKVSVAEFDGPAVIVSSIGSLCGKSFLATGKFTTLANVQVVFPDQAQIDPYFLWLLVNDQDFWVRGQTGQPFIRPSDIKKAWIPKPPEQEQKAMRAIIESLDSAISAARESIAKAERLQKGLMQQLLTGRLKPDGTRRKQSEFWSDPKLGYIPKGWIVEKGWKIAAKITKGQSPKWQGFDYTTSGMLFVTSENVRDGYLDLTEPKFLPVEFNEKIKGSELKRGDVLINLVGASIGRSCIFDSDYSLANVNQAVCVFRPKPGIVSRFIGYYLRLQSTQHRLMSSQVETARSNISLADVRRLKFVLPEDKDEQNQIADRVHKVTLLIEAKVQKIAALQRLKKSLMQNLLTGRIRLPVNGAAKEAKP